MQKKISGFYRIIPTLSDDENFSLVCVYLNKKEQRVGMPLLERQPYIQGNKPDNDYNGVIHLLFISGHEASENYSNSKQRHEQTGK